MNIDVNFNSGDVNFSMDFGSGFPFPGGGTTDYDALQNRPKINNVTLTGNKDFGDLGLESLTNSDIEALLNNFIG